MIQKLCDIDVFSRIDDLITSRTQADEHIQQIDSKIFSQTDLQIVNLLLFGWINLIKRIPDEIISLLETDQEKFAYQIRNHDQIEILKSTFRSSESLDLMKTTIKVIDNLKTCKFKEIKNALLNFEITLDGFKNESNKDSDNSIMGSSEFKIILATMILDSAFTNDYPKSFEKRIDRLLPSYIVYRDLSAIEIATYNLIFFSTDETLLDETLYVYCMLHLIKVIFNSSLPKNKTKQMLYQYTMCYGKLKKRLEFQNTYSTIEPLLEKYCDAKSKMTQVGNSDHLIKKLKKIENELSQSTINNKKPLEFVLSVINRIGFVKIHDHSGSACYVLERSYQKIENKAQLHKFDLQYKATILTILYTPLWDLISGLRVFPKKIFELTDEQIDKVEVIIQRIREQLKIFKGYCNIEFQDRIDTFDQVWAKIQESKIDALLDNIYVIYPTIFEFIRDFLLRESLNEEYKVLPSGENNIFLEFLRQTSDSEDIGGVNSKTKISQLIQK